MRTLAALLLAAVGRSALAPAVAEARPRARHARRSAKQAPSSETRFLGKDPHGPLAVVRGGVLAEPADGACRTWARKGEGWQSLGRLGEITGHHDGFEWFSDSTLHWANGTWKDVDAGIYGSTA